MGIVGVGRFGRLHAQKIASSPKARLVGIFDLDPCRAASVAEETGSRPYPSLDALLRDADALVVTASTSAHHALAKASLLARRHVFVEKPIAQTSEEALELASLVSGKNLVLACGHIERFQPEIAYIRNLGLGPPKYLEAERLHPYSGRSLDVDVIFDLMIHDLDLARWLVGEEAKSIDAVGARVLSDSLDMARAWMAFGGGAVANLAASRVSPNASRKWRLFWEDCYVSLDLLRHTVTLARRLPGTSELASDSVVFAKEDALSKELEAFLSLVREKSGSAANGTPVSFLCNAADALEALILAEGVKDAVCRSPA